MLLVWVRMVLSETVSSRAMSGPLRSLRSSRRTWSSRSLNGSTKPRWIGVWRARELSGCEEVAGVIGCSSLLRGSPKQGGHGWALVEEHSDVALRLRQRQRLFQRCTRSGDVASRLVVERLQHRDLDDAARAMSFLRCGEEALQQPGRVVPWPVRAPRGVLGQEDPGQSDVLELVEVAERVGGGEVPVVRPGERRQPILPWASWTRALSAATGRTSGE